MNLLYRKPNIMNIFLKKSVLVLSLSLNITNFSSQASRAPDGYEVTHTDTPVPQRHRYDALGGVYREHTALRHWQHPLNPGAPFTDNVFSERDGPIQGHDGRTVVYIVPFRTQNVLIPRDQRQNYAGLYQYRFDLNDNQKMAITPLFYRPPNVNAIFHAKVTQQRWEKVDNTLVDFLIVSYKADEKLRFIDDASNSGAQVLNINLPEAGLYQLMAVDNEPNPVDVPPPVINIPGAAATTRPAPQWTERWEKWKRLASDGLLPEPITEIRSPHGVLSIPGVGLFAINEPQPAANDEVGRLKAGKEAADRDVDQIIAQNGAAVGSVVMTGPTGCGKTTFIRCYANNPSVSRERADGTGWELYFPQPFANFAVGHGGHSQTNRPAYYFDQQNSLILCDNPGDDDTNGPIQDIINAGMTYRMFKNPAGVKLLITAEESLIKTSHGGYFIKALEALINSFEDDNILHQIAHLMISKRTNLNIQKYLLSLVGNPNAIPPIPQDAKLNGKPRLINLVKFLVDHPERVSTFAEAPTGEPNQEIPFTPDLTGPRASILSGPFVANPPVKIKIKDESHHLVQGLARRLNEDLVKYLRTEGAQQIMNYCLTRITDHNGPVNELRTLFTDLAARLTGISARGTPEEFLRVFDGAPATVGVAAIPQLFDAYVIRDIIANIRFLKSLLPHNVTYNIRDWKDALTSASPYLNTIKKIETLAKKPKVKFKNNILSVKGLFVGVSDIVAAISERNITSTNVKMYALNTLFFDQDLILNGGFIEAFAPRWKVTHGLKTITISGLNGSPGDHGDDGLNATDTVNATAGKDGKPGNPGKNSGSFFGKLYSQINLASLKIIANGGRGGDGGNGGIGGAGRDAGNGQEASMQVTSDTGNVRIIEWGDDPPKASAHYQYRLYYHLNQRDEYIPKPMRDWIGPRYRDQIWVWGHVKQMVHAPQGEVGKDGGKGGQKGLGGNAGEIIIQGSDAVQKEQLPGAVGANNGTAGIGGQGGRNGMVLKGTKWTNCSIEGEPSPNPVDRWHVGPAYENPAQARAANGTPTASNVSTTALSATAPTPATAVVPMDQATKDSKIEAYRTYYREQAKDPLVSPLILAFPMLE